jgi:hypothetical protein
MTERRQRQLGQRAGAPVAEELGGGVGVEEARKTEDQLGFTRLDPGTKLVVPKSR